MTLPNKLMIKAKSTNPGRWSDELLVDSGGESEVEEKEHERAINVASIAENRPDYKDIYVRN